MSYFKFNCPHCQQSLEAPEDMLGQIIECPICKGSVELPRPEPTQTAPNHEELRLHLAAPRALNETRLPASEIRTLPEPTSAIQTGLAAPPPDNILSFQYTALDAKGNINSGEVAAKDKNAAIKTLREKGLYLTKICYADQTARDSNKKSNLTFKKNELNEPHPMARWGGILAALGWGYFILPEFGYQFIILQTTPPAVAVFLIVIGTVLILLDGILTVRGWFCTLRARRKARRSS